MSGLARLCLAAVILLQYGCVTLMPNQFRDRHGLSAINGDKTDQARATIAAALHAADAPAIDRAVSEAVFLVLQEGDTIKGRAAVDSLVFDAARHHNAEFNRAGLHSCADGRFQDYGTFAIHGASNEQGTSRTGTYAMLWSPGEGGQARLDAVMLYSPGDRKGHRRPPCPTLADEQWKSPRALVFMRPAVVSTLAGSWSESLDDAITAAGWPTRGPSGSGGTSASLGNGLGVQTHIYRSIHVSASAHALSGSSTAYGAPGHARLDYDGLVVGLAPGFKIGPLSFAGGPAYLSLDGTWTTTWEIEHPPFNEPPSSWESWTLGFAADVSVLMPVSRRLGFDLRVLHRYFPEADIPGYRGSDPSSVDFSHLSVLAGLALRF